MFGGGIFNNGMMTVTDSTVSGNNTGGLTAGYGGGIYNHAGSAMIRNSTISNNGINGNGTGGGIYSATPFTITN